MVHMHCPSRVKERLADTSRALQEADNWTSLDNQVQYSNGTALSMFYMGVCLIDCPFFSLKFLNIVAGYNLNIQITCMELNLFRIHITVDL
jgi:hypothetical protein